MSSQLFVFVIVSDDVFYIGTEHCESEILLHLFTNIGKFTVVIVV